MAVLEEIEEDNEQQKTIAQAKKKLGNAARSTSAADQGFTPKGLGLARGFLNAKPQPQRGPDPTDGEAAKDGVKTAKSKAASGELSTPEPVSAVHEVSEELNEKRGDEGQREAASANKPLTEGLAKGFLTAPANAGSQAARTLGVKVAHLKEGNPAEGFARGFLNPKRGTSVEDKVGAAPGPSSGNGDIIQRDDVIQSAAQNGGEGTGTRLEAEGLAVGGNADITNRNADAKSCDSNLQEGAPRRAEDTWSVETQVSDRCEMHEEMTSASGGRVDMQSGVVESSENSRERDLRNVLGAGQGAGLRMEGSGSKLKGGSRTKADSGGASEKATGVIGLQEKGGTGSVGKEPERSGGQGTVKEEGDKVEVVDLEGEPEGALLPAEHKGSGLEGKGEGAERFGEAKENEETQGLECKEAELEGRMQEEKRRDEEEIGEDKGETKHEGGGLETGESTSKSVEGNAEDGNQNRKVEDKADGKGQQGGREVEGVLEKEGGEKERGAEELEEEEFHDACEDEEQQRKQALAQAEEARARGNELYAIADYERALEVYSKALNLAPPAYITVETPPQDEDNASGEEKSTSQASGGQSEATSQGDPDVENESKGGESSEKRLGSEVGGQSASRNRGGAPETSGVRRVRPPKVLDPKTGRLVVPDEDSEESEKSASETGAKEGGKSKAPATEQRADAEAINCRAACHANRAACFVQLNLHDAAVRECSEALKLKPDYLKVTVRRAQAYDKLDKQEEALTDWKTVLEKDPSHRQARAEVRRLEPIVNEKREKMKEEMMGKLKELGNSLLGHFGLSVDNFKAVQDPNTGGYSINFSK